MGGEVVRRRDLQGTKCLVTMYRALDNIKKSNKGKSSNGKYVGGGNGQLTSTTGCFDVSHMPNAWSFSQIFGVE